MYGFRLLWLGASALHLQLDKIWKKLVLQAHLFLNPW